MSTPGPNPVDPDEPIEEWRPGTDRDGNEEDTSREGGDDGEYDQEEREDGGTDVSGRGHPDEPGDDGAGSDK